MTLAILRALMGVYTMIALADFAFLVTGYIVARRLPEGSGLSGIIAVIWLFGAAYLMLFLLLLLPGCPNGRWAC